MGAMNADRRKQVHRMSQFAPDVYAAFRAYCSVSFSSIFVTPQQTGIAGDKAEFAVFPFLDGKARRIMANYSERFLSCVRTFFASFIFLIITISRFHPERASEFSLGVLASCSNSRWIKLTELTEDMAPLFPIH